MAGGQRKHERFELFAQVELHLASGVEILAVRNVSLGGFFVETEPGDLPDVYPGVVAHVALFSSDDSVGQVQGDATVTRVDPGVAGLRAAGFGFQWKALDREALGRLTRIVEAVMKKGG